MNRAAMAQAVQAEVRPKFRGHTTLKSKVVPHFPDGLAREYERITNTYMTLLNKTLAEHLPVIRKAIDAEREGLRRDDAQDILALIESEFLRINEDYMSRTEKFSLASKLLGISVLARNHKIREWKRVVSKTLGISIFDDYFKGEFFREMLKVWVAQNIDLIKTIPKNTLLKMRYAIEEGYTDGMVNTAIGKRIQEIYGIDRRRARFIARDQIAKLNADITQAQHRDAGVSEYIWSTSEDERVRRGHMELNGKKFSWSDPPVVDGRSGRRCHPGQDYQCRCAALPVFNLPELDLPWDGKELN